MKVVIAAAGTGGHINPGIAIANKIMEKEPQSKIIFIGTGRGLEKDLVPRAGYELKTVEAYGINRKINLDNIKRLCKTIKAVGQAKKILKEFKPDIVIGTGGYICASVCMAANQLKIPIILHESNAFPGVAVKVMAKKANEILLGFEEAKERISNARKIVVTGTPTKVNSNRLSDEQKYNLKQEMKLKQDLPVVLFFGGSQGAQSINNAILGIIENKLNEKYQIVWAVGPGNYDEVKEKLRIKNIDIDNIENTKILPYIYNMQEVMEMSDLVVCRSGAMTITEIATIGKPAIFIPYPFATENHQEYNAKVLEKVGAAKIILDKELNFTKLNNTINNIVKDTETLKTMGESAKRVARADVEENIYKEICRIVSKHETRNNLPPE
jgi:UDP-N-acetylglucosamine--N-acetylmuramyl-(pentapeptide) pyrophosphoryl-undecaprenol N-acetylglucosamine transferase